MPDPSYLEIAQILLAQLNECLKEPESGMRKMLIEVTAINAARLRHQIGNHKDSLIHQACVSILHANTETDQFRCGAHLGEAKALLALAVKHLKHVTGIEPPG